MVAVLASRMASAVASANSRVVPASVSFRAMVSESNIGSDLLGRRRCSVGASTVRMTVRHRHRAAENSIPCGGQRSILAAVKTSRRDICRGSDPTRRV